MSSGDTKLTKENLIDIRNAIVNTDYLFVQDDLRFFRNYFEINCYLYALGIVKISAFSDVTFVADPGFTVDPFCKKRIWTKNLLKAIKVDLKNIQIQYREISLNGYSKLRKDEYLVKVFNRVNSKDNSEDFHFMRFDPEKEVWFHKAGESFPKVINREYGVQLKYGYEPVGYEIRDDDFYAVYEPIGYFAIKELKKTK